MKIVKNVERNAMEQILEEAQAHHESVIERIKSEHAENLKRIKNSLRVHTVKEHKGDEPKALGNGVIVQPGNYYVENGEHSFGISKEELAQAYSEVK